MKETTLAITNSIGLGVIVASLLTGRLDVIPYGIGFFLGPHIINRLSKTNEKEVGK